YHKLLRTSPSWSSVLLQERDHIGIKPLVSKDAVVVPSRIQAQARMRDPLSHLCEEVRRIVAILLASNEQSRSRDLVEAVSQINRVLGAQHRPHPFWVLDPCQGSDHREDATPAPLPEAGVTDQGGKCAVRPRELAAGQVVRIPALHLTTKCPQAIG